MEINKKLYEHFKQLAAPEEPADTSPYAGIDVEAGKDIGEDDLPTTPSNNIIDRVATDIVDTVQEWGQGAVDNIKGMYEAGQEQAAIVPDNTGFDYGYTEPEYTPEQQAVIDKTNSAASKFAHETVKPALIAATTVTANPLLAGLTAPFIAEDFLETSKTSGTLQAAKEFVPGYTTYSMMTDNKMKEFVDAHPGRALLYAIADIAAPIQTARGVYKGLKGEAKNAPSTKILPKEAIPEFNMQGEIVVAKPKAAESPLKNNESLSVDVVENYHTKRGADIDNTLTALTKQKEDLIKKGKTKGLRRLEREIKEATAEKEMVSQMKKNADAKIASVYIKKEVAQSDTAKVVNDLTEVRDFAGVKGTGRDIPVAESTYDKPVTQTNLKQAINDLTPFRVGRGVSKTKGSLGYFETVTEGIRTNEHGEYGVTAHEIGHFLDKKLQLEGASQELIDNAKVVWGENTYKPNQLRSEGIAEFTREYILNPQEAQKNFPKYFKMFEDALEKHPDLATKLDTVAQMTRKWYSQDAEARVRGSMVFENDKKPTTLKESLKNLWDKTYTDMFDKYDPIKSIVKFAEKRSGIKVRPANDPYMSALMAENVIKARAEMFLKGDKYDLQALREIYGEKALPNDITLYDVLKTLDHDKLNTKYPDYLKRTGSKDWYEALGTYLTAKRALEVHTEQINANKKALQVVIKELQETLKKAIDEFDGETITKTAEKLENYERQLLNVEDTHKMAVTKADLEVTIKNAPAELEKASAAWKLYNENFLNMAEEFGLIKTGEAARLREESDNYSPMQRSFYEEGYKGHPTSNNTEDFLHLQSLYKALDEGGSTRPYTDPILTMADMTKRLFALGERNKVGLQIVELAKGEGMSELAMRVSGQEANTKKNIFYVYENGTKQPYQAICPELIEILKGDPAIAMSTIETGVSMAAAALRVTATENPAFWLFNVSRDTVLAAAQNPNKKQFIPFFSTLKGLYILRNDPKTVALYKASGAKYTTMASDTKTAVRKLAKQTGVKTWREATPMSFVEHVFDTYHNIGQNLEDATRISLFKQALVENEGIITAGYRAAETTTNFSRSGRVGKRLNRSIPFLNAVLQGTDKSIRLLFKEQPVKTAMQTAFYITTPSVALWYMNHNEDWYKNTPVDIKNRFWLFKKGDIIYRLPKPEAVGFVFGSLAERALDYAVDNNIDAKPSAMMALSNLTPNVLVQAYKPIMEIILNQNTFTGRPIESYKDFEVTPGERYDVYTSQMAKTIGAALNVSPKKLDHIGRGYFSGYFNMLSDTVDLITPPDNSKPAKTWKESAIIGRFIHNPEKYPSYVTAFYDGLKDLQQYKNSKFGDKKKIGKLKDMNKVDKEMAKLNKVYYEIREDPNLSAERKRVLLDKNREHFNEKARLAVVHILGKKYYEKKTNE